MWGHGKGEGRGEKCGARKGVGVPVVLVGYECMRRPEVHDRDVGTYEDCEYMGIRSGAFGVECIRTVGRAWEGCGACKAWEYVRGGENEWGRLRKACGRKVRVWMKRVGS